MNPKLKLELDNSPLATSDAVADEATLRAMAIESVRQDSCDSPSDYLHETEAPYGGE